MQRAFLDDDDDDDVPHSGVIGIICYSDPDCDLQVSTNGQKFPDCWSHLCAGSERAGRRFNNSPSQRVTWVLTCRRLLHIFVVMEQLLTKSRKSGICLVTAVCLLLCWTLWLCTLSPTSDNSLYAAFCLLKVYSLLKSMTKVWLDDAPALFFLFPVPPLLFARTLMVLYFQPLRNCNYSSPLFL